MKQAALEPKRVIHLGYGLYATDSFGGIRLITWSHQSGSDVNLKTVFRKLVQYLNDHNAVIVSERYFGRLKVASTILSLRDRTFLSLHGGAAARGRHQVTYIEGEPIHDTMFAGFQMMVFCDPVEVGNVGQTGRLIRGRDSEYLFFSDIGRSLGSHKRFLPEEDAEACFNSIDHELKSNGWSMHDVVRTWFYLTDILDWYDEFNHVRNTFFQKEGIFHAHPESRVPASTGISGNGSSGWCHLDVLAMRGLGGKPLEVKRLENPLQNEAPSYGSAFSRGLAVHTTSQTNLFVSGTASIDKSGQSIHINCFERQVRQTVENIRALLEVGGARLQDIGQSTVFIKRAEDIPAFWALADEMDFPLQTAVCVLADVCRDDLLFEIDATAIMPRLNI